MGSGGQRKIDSDPLPVQLHARALIFGRTRVFRVLIVHETKSPRPAGLCVVDQLQAVNRTEFGKYLAYLGFCRVHV